MERVNTVIVGGGQAGLAMSEHLGKEGISHLVLERGRIAESWRTARWDSLVANGPAWHDRFPSKEFDHVGPDDFAPKEVVADYFEQFAKEIRSPIRCGVEVLKAYKAPGEKSFIVETSDGAIEADNIVAATGPFQVPIIPPVVPDDAPVRQLHSRFYKNPDQIEEGAVLVVGAGSSGVQIANELLDSGRKTYLSLGPHDRPPRRYRGKDNVWWLGVLGKWEMKTPPEGREHVTISVSGADGGHTIDFRQLAEKGMHLVGMTKAYEGGVLSFADDLADNIRLGDENYLSLLREADAYIAANALDFPAEPEAHIIGEDPLSVKKPTLEINLAAEDIKTIIWATGYRQDFGWLQVDAFDESGKPDHENGVCKEPGIYFLGLPWLSMRGSSFIWGVWKDALNLAGHIKKRA